MAGYRVRSTYNARDALQNPRQAGWTRIGMRRKASFAGNSRSYVTPNRSHNDVMENWQLRYHQGTPAQDIW
jgi:hypothetical protein